MRGLHFHHGARNIEDCPATTPGDALIAAIDSALTFARSRQTMTGAQAASMLAMVRVSSALSTEPGMLRDALEGAAAWSDGRDLISGAALVDRLLDMRLCVRAPLDDVQEPDWTELDPFVRT